MIAAILLRMAVLFLRYEVVDSNRNCIACFYTFFL